MCRKLPLLIHPSRADTAHSEIPATAGVPPALPLALGYNRNAGITAQNRWDFGRTRAQIPTFRLSRGARRPRGELHVQTHDAARPWRRRRHRRLGPAGPALRRGAGATAADRVSRCQAPALAPAARVSGNAAEVGT